MRHYAKLVRTTLTALLMLVPVGAAFAGPLEDGVAARNSGDYATALRLFRALADKGNANAQSYLGFMYENGWGVQQDYAEALKWFRKAADQGDPLGDFNLYFLASDAEAFKWFRLAAGADDAFAQGALGYTYEEGAGLPQNYAEAMKWYRKAADLGDPYAQNKLGLMYAKGEGVPENSAEAMKWYRKAADHGNAFAQINLGKMYSDGRGVPQNYAEALKWYRKAADEGNAFAQTNLGYMYYEGSKYEGVPQNYAEAMKWYRKAADQGNATAQLNLGNMYYTGRSVPQNYAEALKWYQKAAEQGNASAQFNLGTFYHDGQGIPKDYVNAYLWFNLSASQGNKDAAKYRDQTAYSMTSEQIAEAQKLTREWKPRSSEVSPGSGVSMKNDGGIFVVPVEINGAMTLDFAVDSGAADVSVPADVFSTLVRTGTIRDTDITGEQLYALADGSKMPASTFTIRSLKVGDMVLENVRASVAPAQGPLLLGQSFLERFKSWSINNKKHELLFEPE